MSRKILETNNYNKFVLAPFQRQIRKTKRLKASMLRDGFWDDEPILVQRVNSKLAILRGQHRFHVARELGIPVKYLETKRDVNIPGEEIIRITWNMQDHLFAYCEMGNEHYLRLREYHQRTGIPLACCVALLAGDAAGSTNRQPKFRNGTFRVGNLSHSRVVESIITQSRESGFPYWNSQLFVQAVSKVAFSEGFGSEVLKEKIKTFVQFMKKEPSMQHYVELLDSIYNRQSHIKIPLAFLAEEAARKRNIIKQMK